MDLKSTNRHWLELKPWPGPPRMLAMASSCDGVFYLAGGVALQSDAAGKPARSYLRDAYSFTPGKGWRRLADLPRPIAAAPSLACGGYGLVIFSGDPGDQANVPPSPAHPGFLRSALGYDRHADAWIELGSVPFSRSTTSAVEWRGHIVIPVGEVRPRERSTEVWWAELPGKASERGDSR